MAHSRLIILVALALVTSAASAQSYNERYSIMRPEPGAKRQLPHIDLVPTYKSPRGTRNDVVIPRPATPPLPHAQVPPPLYVPQTGQTLPNMPMQGSGPGGRETYQDRAIRCAHQAGVYGQSAGNSNAYIGSCINQ